MPGFPGPTRGKSPKTPRRSSDEVLICNRSEPMNEQKKSAKKAYRKSYDATVKYINVSLPLTTHAAFLRKAKQHKLSVTTYFRNLALKAFHFELIASPQIEKDLHDLTLLIRNIANNINQIARHSNTVRKLISERELLRELHNLELSIKSYTRTN